MGFDCDSNNSPSSKMGNGQVHKTEIDYETFFPVLSLPSLSSSSVIFISALMNNSYVPLFLTFQCTCCSRCIVSPGLPIPNFYL